MQNTNARSGLRVLDDIRGNLYPLAKLRIFERIMQRSDAQLKKESLRQNMTIIITIYIISLINNIS